MKPIYRYDHVAQMWLQQWTEAYIIEELCGHKEPPPPSQTLADALRNFDAQQLNSFAAQQQMSGYANLYAMQNASQFGYAGGLNALAGLSGLFGRI